jgi:ankyrin repeat protein
VSFTFGPIHLNHYEGLPLHRVAGGPCPLKGYYVSRGDQLLPAPVATIELLLSEAPNTVNSQDTEGRTPLHHAINIYSRYTSKRLDTAKVLCENGADASLRDKRGQTPLHVLADRAGGAESIDMVLVDLLLAHGARGMILMQTATHLYTSWPKGLTI